MKEEITARKTLAEQDRLKSQLRAVKDSFSFRLGNILVQAVYKPGRNTILLPYRLIRMCYAEFKKRKTLAAGSHTGTKPQFVVAGQTTLPPDEADKAKDFWSRYSVQKGSVKLEEWSHFMAEEVLRFSPASVFEFGCHNGRNLIAIRNRVQGVTCHGIDINPDAVAVAKKAELEDVQLGDENTLHSLPDATFDVCFTSSVLDHIPTPLHAMVELLRISRKACLFFEPFLGVEGKVIKNYNVSKEKVVDTTPFSYSWDYLGMIEAVNAYAFQGSLTVQVINHPIKTNLGRFYRLYIVQRQTVP